MRVAIVTGASKGFGLAVTKALVEAGWQVVVDARHADELALATASLAPAVHLVPGDVTDAEHLHLLVARASALGGLDLLVNNAGTLGPSPLPRVRDLEPRALADAFRTNVEAALALLQVALPLLEASSGAVVNVTSDAAVEAYEGWGGYGATKAALELLTAVLGKEEQMVRVYAFDPGDLRTEMHQAAYPGEDISDRPPPETVAPALLRLVEERPPSGRYRAADYAKAK
jgi:NAD(P)-dependent dehydrogenase (short-subunit alcohol dehydrogenase family)